MARELTLRDRHYHTLDDLDVLDIARTDPDVLLGGEQPITLDEVQREPDLLKAVKRAIDRRRDPGRFLLTGSSNLLLMHRVSESLARRASYLTLWPMTRQEQAGVGQCGIWDQLVSAPEGEWPDIIRAQDGDLQEDWRRLARRGGFPTPALELGSDEDRAVWFDG